jgi:hypothetical protein
MCPADRFSVYIDRNDGSMNTGSVGDTVTLRRDMRNAAGGLLVTRLSIGSPEGNVGSDLVAVPNPVTGGTNGR